VVVREQAPRGDGSDTTRAACKGRSPSVLRDAGLRVRDRQLIGPASGGSELLAVPVVRAVLQLTPAQGNAHAVAHRGHPWNPVQGGGPTSRRQAGGKHLPQTTANDGAKSGSSSPDSPV